MIRLGPLDRIERACLAPPVFFWSANQAAAQGGVNRVGMNRRGRLLDMGSEGYSGYTVANPGCAVRGEWLYSMQTDRRAIIRRRIPVGAWECFASIEPNPLSDPCVNGRALFWLGSEAYPYVLTKLTMAGALSAGAINRPGYDYQIVEKYGVSTVLANDAVVLVQLIAGGPNEYDAWHSQTIIHSAADLSYVSEAFIQSTVTNLLPTPQGPVFHRLRQRSLASTCIMKDGFFVLDIDWDEYGEQSNFSWGWGKNVPLNATLTSFENSGALRWSTSGLHNILLPPGLGETNILWYGVCAVAMAADERMIYFNRVWRDNRMGVDGGLGDVLYRHDVVAYPHQGGVVDFSAPELGPVAHVSFTVYPHSGYGSRNGLSFTPWTADQLREMGDLP